MNSLNGFQLFESRLLGDFA